MNTGGYNHFTLPPEHGAQGLALTGLLIALSPAAVLVLGVMSVGILGFFLAGLVAAPAGIFAIFFGYTANQKRSTYGSIAILLGVIDTIIGIPVIIDFIANSI